MRSVLVLIAALVVSIAFYSGCGGTKETVKVDPNTLPDRGQVQTDQDAGGYDRYGDNYQDYASDEVPLELLTVHFEYDRYDLTPEAIEILSVDAQALREHPQAVIRIEGHCDERGTEEYNMALGEKRAQTVREYLTNYGIDPRNISIISYGELMPVDSRHSEAAWKKNRRADFVVQSE